MSYYNITMKCRAKQSEYIKLFSCYSTFLLILSVLGFYLLVGTQLRLYLQLSNSTIFIVDTFNLKQKQFCTYQIRNILILLYITAYIQFKVSASFRCEHNPFIHVVIYKISNQSFSVDVHLRILTEKQIGLTLAVKPLTEKDVRLALRAEPVCSHVQLERGRFISDLE